MSETKRENFSGKFKAKVALEAIRGIKTLNEIGQEFGVHPTQVGLWKKELQEQAGSLFDAKRGPKPVDPSASSDRLYSEIGRLKMELDWLKKSPGSASRVEVRKQWVGASEPLALTR
ncbi:mobile element protein [Sulfuriferula multivorans]|uniref:Mobile element protein n=1 Tax=Sulfuriferula multivorans TaxID=1559896 RepID=A0A401JHA2_9PROT|nr:mobile element protein [Sulfuriferula multivorans]